MDPADPRPGMPGSVASWIRRRASDPLAFVSVSTEALGRYKLRTGLSVLGVVLGVAAVIAMTSVSEGARHDTLEQVQQMGLDNVVLRGRFVEPGRAPALVAGDAARLLALLPLAERTSVLVERFGEVHGNGRTVTAQVLGVDPDYGRILRLTLAQGRFLAAVDRRAQGPVCVLGAQLTRELFGHRSAMGQSVRFSGEWFQVVGVLADRGADARSAGSLASRDLDRVLVVPATRLLHDPLADSSERPVDEIWVQLGDGSKVAAVGGIAAHTMHRLGRRAEDVEVIVPRELLRQRFRTQRTFAVVVGSVAVLSLLVGGIGIMNIMLASVVERTHEIGIRRAVGATRGDVAAQFLVESLLMTLSGGLAGIVLGAATSWIVTFYAGWTTRLSLLSVVLAFAVSFAVGIGFGLYPARRAAALQPIDALRFE